MDALESVNSKEILKKDYKVYYFSFLLGLGFILLLASGCRKMESSQAIPSYIKIDSVYLDTYYPVQGSASQEISDVWVYVDDQQMGVFQLPALFPILAEGNHRLEIRPGIKLNGISSTRVPYPFYQPIVFENFNFVPDSVMDLGNIKTEYYENIKFAWLEDFEGSYISIRESETSDTTIEQTIPADSPEAFLSDHSSYSGKIVLTQSNPMFWGYSFNGYDLPRDGTPVALELNFKTDTPMLVGVLTSLPGDFKWDDLVYLNKSSEWNKIYVNLAPTTSRYPNAYDFKIYFRAIIGSDVDISKIYIDNIKLLYRQ